jgi:dihydroneopterin aldolase
VLTGLETSETGDRDHRGVVGAELDARIVHAHALATRRCRHALTQQAIRANAAGHDERVQPRFLECAQRLAMTVLGEFGIEWVRLSINKPGAIRGSRDVGVSIERTRADLQ